MQKIEIWSVDNEGYVVCNYTTWKGRDRSMKFKLVHIQKNEGMQDRYFLVGVDNKGKMSHVSYNNLCDCYSPLFNSTQLGAFITCDLTKATLRTNI